MALITIPSTDLLEQSWTLARGDSALETFTGSEVILEDLAAFWLTTFRPLPVQDADARAWGAALARLSRLSNTFEIAPPLYEGNTAGYAGAAPVVQGGSQLGRSLLCDGVTAGATIAHAGNYLEVNGELKRITADATANGSGVVTIEFEPALRESPADNASVDIETPKATMRLLQPVAEEAWRVPNLLGLTIQAREAF